MNEIVDCPYCNEPNRIDDYNGWDEINVECGECGKPFEIVAHQTVSFEAFCAAGCHDVVHNKEDDKEINGKKYFYVTCSRCEWAHFMDHFVDKVEEAQ